VVLTSFFGFAVYSHIASKTSSCFAYKWNGRLSIYNSYSK